MLSFAIIDCFQFIQQFVFSILFNILIIQYQKMYNQIQSEASIPNPYSQPDQYGAASPAPYYSLQISSPPAVTTSRKPDQSPLSHLEDGLQGQAQKKFIMKVYIILSMQLALTVAVCFVSYYVRPFLQFQYNNQWVMWLLFVIMILTEVLILVSNIGRKYPFNLLLLLVFTLCQAYFISYICSVVAYQSGAEVVVVAAVMTLAIVLALTLYAFLTPTDFTTKWGVVIVISVAMLTLGIFSIFMPSAFLTNFYCCLGVILFGIYLIIDTQLIIGRGRLGLSYDDHVVGALILYIDIIQIFLYLLEILSKK